MNTRLNHLHDVAHAAVEVVANEAQDIAHISADFRRASGHRKDSLRGTLTQRLDDLLFTMLDAFRGSVSEDDATALLREHHPLTETRLAKLPPAAVPLVVMRELVSVHQVPVDREHLQNWGMFRDRYQTAVV